MAGTKRMTSTLDEYRKASETIPNRMLRWHLYGAGLENLGRGGGPEVVDVPAFGPDELLVRQDACGLCFSDTKVIALGADHPRMAGRDLAADPVTLGHEVACTVVGVGELLRDRFAVGSRFVVQADVFYRGVSMAYGYAIRGGLAQYSVIPKPILEGDEGCYLLPIRPDTGYVEAALTEPWACVVSAYEQRHRDGLAPGGRLLVVAGDADGPPHRWDTLLRAGCAPAEAVVYNAIGSVRDAIQRAAVALGIGVEWKTAESASLAAELRSDPPQARFDDILLPGAVSAETIEAAATNLANHGILNIARIEPVERPLSLDIGRIHYNWHQYLGTGSDDIAGAYREPRSADLLAGGCAWFVGAGGPMGQMHVQRAVLHTSPPRLIVASDIDAVRLRSVGERFAGAAAARGVELVLLNPIEQGAERFDAELRRLAPRGFDDIVSLVPAAAVIEHAAQFLANGGWFNIFAGVARGTMARLDVNRVIRDGCRFLGSSGSSLSDMRETLARVESDELSTNASLAAIGGMNAAAEGLRAVKEGWFPGKTLIFPQIPDLPLTTLAGLKERFPTVYARLENGAFWTQAAEEELLRVTLGSRPETDLQQVT